MVKLINSNVLYILFFFAFIAVALFTGCDVTLSDSGTPVKISNTSVTEGNVPDLTDCEFTISLLSDPFENRKVEVEWATKGITAEEGVDFVSASGTVTLTKKEPEAVITVQVIGDWDFEDTEQFKIILTGGKNVDLYGQEGICTIYDNEISAEIQEVTLTEGHSPDVTTVQVPVVLSSLVPPGETVSVDWYTLEFSAVEGNDYNSSSGTLVFTRFDGLIKTIPVDVNGDDHLEPTEAFYVYIHNPDNCVINVNSARVDILDDDVGVSISDNLYFDEGDTPGTVEAVFDVTLTGPPTQGRTVSVDWSTVDDTAVAGNDFIGATGTVSFDSTGPLTKQVSISIISDDIIEPDERFYVYLSNPDKLSIEDGSGRATIKNDDSSKVYITESVSIDEGDEKEVSQAVFTVSLDIEPSPGDDAVVNWTTYDLTAEDEGGDGDYKSASGKLTFVSGEGLIKQLTIDVYGDNDPEFSETFGIKLTGLMNTNMQSSRGTCTINADDQGIYVSSLAVGEGNSPGTTDISCEVGVILDPEAGNDISVDWTTADGTAEDESGDGDYVSANGTAVFTNGGSLTQSVTITVNGDDITENDESFYVQLSNPLNGIIIQDTAEISIVNDDGITVRRVDPTSTGAQNGLSWTTAYRDIQSAVDSLSGSGGEVWVASGTYTNGGGTLEVLSMVSGVKVYGGFSGYNSGTGLMEISRAKRDIENNETILDGEDRVYHIVQGADNSLLDGFTVTHGSADNIGIDDAGAGLLIVDTSPELVNCIFDDNNANRGGAVYITGSSAPVFRSCTFSNNDGVYGGAVFTDSAQTTTFYSSCFEDNFSDYGAGIYAENNAVLDLTETVFRIGWAELGGGGIHTNGNLTLTSCLFNNNMMWVNGGKAVYFEDATCSVTDTVFKGNRRDKGGTVIFALNGILQCTDSVFTNNYGTGIRMEDNSTVNLNRCKFLGVGGGVHIENNTSVIAENTLFSGCNSAIWALYSDCTITHCTIFRTKAKEGSALWVRYGNLNVFNSLLWDIHGTATHIPFPQIFNDGSTCLYVGSLIEGSGGSASWNSYFGIDGGGNIDVDPKFIFADGPDRTYGTADDGLRLMTGSPCIDTADPSYALAVDINGNPRPVGTGSDMGAFEGEVSYTPSRIYVDASASGNGDGTSWTDAYTSLSTAMYGTHDYDEVWVAQGIYTAPPNSEIVFRMMRDVDIYGGFEGVETDLSQRTDPSAFPTILDGEDTALHVVLGAHNSLLDGFTVKNGRAWVDIMDYYYQCGAGIFCEYNTMQISNCEIMDGTVIDSGGGLYARNSILDINKCYFTRNRRNAFNTINSSVNMTNCRFIKNEGDGPSVYCGKSYWGRASSFINCEISGFFSDEDDIGGICIADMTKVDIINCSINSNTGRGVKIHSTDFTLVNSIIAHNATTYYTDRGAGLAIVESTGSVINTVIFDNFAAEYPNILVGTSTVDYSNCNIQGSGGSAFWDTILGTDNGGNIDTDPMFIHVPLHTRYIGIGDGLSRVRMPSSFLVLYSIGDIIEFNDDGVPRQITAIDSIYNKLTFTPSLSEEAPREWLIQNWGPGETDLNVDLTFQTGSPCIDTGDNTLLPADDFDLDEDLDLVETLPVDLDGNPRVTDGNVPSDGTATVDMGAYEK